MDTLWFTEAEKLFESIDEPFGAGLFEKGDKGPFIRFANAMKRYLEESPVTEYNGGDIYPCGVRCKKRYAIMPNYSFTYDFDKPYLIEKSKEADEMIKKSNFFPKRAFVDWDNSIGGDGFTHSIPNFKRIGEEGFDSYYDRIKNMKNEELREGLSLLIEGIRHRHEKELAYLNSLLDNTEQNGFSREKLSKLIDSLNVVPFKPARNIYEALLSRNYVYYLDLCDNPGRIDADLYHFYKGEDIVPLLCQHFKNVDDNNGWSVAIGHDCNPITLQVLKAIKGKRRPQIELMFTPDMPVDVLEAAKECLMTGCGNPSIYNFNLYKEVLKKRMPYIKDEDLERFNGGGCTESMLAGLSNVGSLDAGINVLQIFSKYLKCGLATYSTFDGFRKGLVDELHSVINKVMLQINAMQLDRMRKYPNPMRTLLIDDCIDAEKEYNAGGARYCWSVINLAGTVNLYDSLISVKDIVYDKKLVSREDFCDLLENNDAYLLRLIKAEPCFGNDDDYADGIAKDLLDRIVPFFDEFSPYLGGKFLPSSIQFTTYAEAGKKVAATPDCRRCGDPLCDSVGPLNGKGKEGPTAVLNSVAKLDLSRLEGTPVLNIAMQKDFIGKSLIPLVRGFMAQGGMHIQISSFCKEDIADAMVHPEKHEDLIVRIGGYTEYFNRLSPDLQKTVYERTLHA